jgi:G3E family GTPase
VSRPRPAQLGLDELLREAEGEHPHDAAESVSFSCARPLDPGRFAAFLESGPRGVVRAKGVVRLGSAGAGVGGGGVWEVQTVGTAIRVRPAPARATTAGARLVLIGSGLDEDALSRALEGCVAGDDEPEPTEHAALAMTRYVPSAREQ